MNLSFFDKPNTDPLLNRVLCSCLSATKSATPISTLKSLSNGLITDADRVIYIPSTTGSTDTLVVAFPGGVLYLIGGIDDWPQMNRLLLDYADGPDPTDTMGCGRTFYRAARGLLATLPSQYDPTNNRVFVVGHSFGGAVAMVLGAYLQSIGITHQIRVWSYGAPRPGGPALADRLMLMQNTRWYTQADPVPHLPPHADEVPTMYLVTSVNTWRNTNVQVQAPSGYAIWSTGNIVPGMGTPGPDSAFTLSLGSFMLNNVTGVGSPSHSINTYFQYFSAAFALNPRVPQRPIQVPETPLVQRPRERDATIAIGRAEIFADATNPTGSTRTYIVPQVTDPASPRYVARRDGKVWVVKLGEEIVAAATGKRNAKHIARNWNRTARGLIGV